MEEPKYADSKIHQIIIIIRHTGRNDSFTNIELLLRLLNLFANPVIQSLITFDSRFCVQITNAYVLGRNRLFFCLIIIYYYY